MRSASLIAVLTLGLACQLPTFARGAGGQAAEPPAFEAVGNEWTLPAGDYASTRFSSLRDINTRNVGKLHAVWDFSAGVIGGYEGQPLVVNNTLYVVTPWPDVLYAFDLTKPGYPLLFKYRPNVSRDAIGQSTYQTPDRGPVYADGKIIYNLLDGHTVAVDARTGRQLWKTLVANVHAGEKITMAPLVVKNRVIVGTSGGEYGVMAFAKGLDLQTGRVVWTAYSEGPPAKMLIEPGIFKPPFGTSADAGETTWAHDSWKHGGGAVWGWISYDPTLDLIYYGTGNASPWNADQRRGDDKWTCSVMARRPENGALVWAYQFTPHDSWDFDSTGAMILADLTIDGKPVKALVHFDKNGFAYTLDRKTGRPLVAAEYVPNVNWAKSIDLATGRPVINPAKLTGASKGEVKDICPTPLGGVDPLSPGAYSPVTHLFYTSFNNLCMTWTAHHITYIKASPYEGVQAPLHIGPGGYGGGFLAWNAATGRKVWERKFRFPGMSGALVTAGNVVFFGTLEGWFEAADARTGKLLWKFKVGSGVMGAPITFRGPDGKQYVAVYAGLGGSMGLNAGDIRTANPDDLRPKNKPFPDLARYTSEGDVVWIFGL